MDGLDPDWKVETLDGRVLGREELKGKVVLIDMWATWCPPCVAAVPGFVGLQEKYRERGLVIVGLSADRNLEVLNRFLEQRGVNYPVAPLDMEVAAKFGLGENVILPTSFVIDREGRVRHGKVGAAPIEYYEKLILPLL